MIGEIVSALLEGWVGFGGRISQELVPSCGEVWLLLRLSGAEQEDRNEHPMATTARWPVAGRSFSAQSGFARDRHACAPSPPSGRARLPPWRIPVPSAHLQAR